MKIHEKDARMIKKYGFLSMLLFSTLCYGVKVSVGDETTANVTFDFSIGKSIYNSEHLSFWTVSGQDISAKSDKIQDFGIAETYMISGDGSSTVDLKSYAQMTQEAQVVTYDVGTKKPLISDAAAHPLRGKKITQLSMISDKPVAVEDGYANAKNIYAFQEVKFIETGSDSNSTVLAKHALADDNQVINFAGLGMNLLYASAVNAGADATFGTDASKIGFVAWKSAAIDKKAYYYFYPEKEEDVTVANEVLKASTTNLAGISSFVEFHPYGNTSMLCGLGVTAANTAGTDCGVAAMRVDVKNTVLKSDGSVDTNPEVTFVSILPDAVAQAGKNTVISASRNASVAVRNITTTTTSTGLQYLIVARDNGVGGQQSVYAVPLVTQSATAADNGKIAKFDSLQAKFQITGTVYRQQGFEDVVDDADEIDIAGGAAVVKRITVGGQAVPVAAGAYVQQMFAQGDSIYVSVSAAYSGGGVTQPGIFKSQAVFDVQGRIVSWTPWTRVAGTDQKIIFSMNNKTSRQVMYVTEGVAGSGTFDSIKQTTWNDSNAQYSTFTDKVQEVISDDGGVQGLFSFSRATSGFATNKIALIVATGLNNAVIGQTGYDDGGDFKVKTVGAGDVISLTSVDGLDIGSIVTAEFADDGADHWLFFGGNKGLSVLRTAAGVGWNGNLANVAALTGAGQTCTTIGNFSFVKKVAHDGTYLYVMTLDALYRIALDADKFKDVGPDALDAVEVVKAKDLNIHASLLDVIVDDELILLGTTVGMYSIDDSGRPGGDPVITEVDIPGGVSAVGKLSVVSEDANMYKKFKALSNVYVLTFDFGTEQARLNRFNVTAGVITAIEDRLLEGQDSSLLIFNNFKNNLFIDGGLGFVTSYKIDQTAPVLKNLLPGVQAGKSSTHVLIRKFTYDIVLSALSSANSLVGIGSDSASGATVIGGDFGILMNA